MRYIDILNEALRREHLGPTSVPANIQCGADILEFDAKPYLEIASDNLLLDLVRYGYVSFELGVLASAYDAEIEKFIQDTSVNDDENGWNCYVDEEYARLWVQLNRPHIIAQINA